MVLPTLGGHSLSFKSLMTHDLAKQLLSTSHALLFMLNGSANLIQKPTLLNKICPMPYWIGLDSIKHKEGQFIIRKTHCLRPSAHFQSQDRPAR